MMSKATAVDELGTFVIWLGLQLRQATCTLLVRLGQQSFKCIINAVSYTHLTLPTKA